MRSSTKLCSFKVLTGKSHSLLIFLVDPWNSRICRNRSVDGGPEFTGAVRHLGFGLPFTVLRWYHAIL